MVNLQSRNWATPWPAIEINITSETLCIISCDIEDTSPVQYSGLELYLNTVTRKMRQNGNEQCPIKIKNTWEYGTTFFKNVNSIKDAESYFIITMSVPQTKGCRDITSRKHLTLDQILCWRVEKQEKRYISDKFDKTSSINFREKYFCKIYSSS